jgi:hypothetical protein
MSPTAIGALLVILVAIAAIFGFFGFAAMSDMAYVCPDGNQCPDAVSTIWLSAVVVGVCVAAGAFTMWLAGRR